MADLVGWIRLILFLCSSISSDAQSLISSCSHEGQASSESVDLLIIVLNITDKEGADFVKRILLEYSASVYMLYRIRIVATHSRRKIVSIIFYALKQD
jgi:hypothetical protein